MGYVVVDGELPLPAEALGNGLTFGPETADPYRAQRPRPAPLPLG